MMTTDRHTPYRYAKADLKTDLVGVLLIVIAALFGFAGGLATAELKEPNCPTEDSCAYQYYGPNDYDFGEVTP